MHGLGNVTVVDSHAKRNKCVSTSDFTADEEIVLPQLSSALPDTSSPDSHSVNRDLSRLIDTNTVVIESLERHAKLMSFSMTWGCHSLRRSCTDANFVS